MAVTFTRTTSGDVETFRCRETGCCYQLELNRQSNRYLVRNAGMRVLHLEYVERLDAITAIEQQANLDYRTAQSESAFDTEA